MTLLLAICCLTGLAHANERAKELFLNGKELYNQGRYESAIIAWKEAYALDPRPVLLFNLANAYERSGQFEEALDALERYRPLAKPEEGEVLDTRIRALEDRVREIEEERRRAEEERLAAQRALEEERRRAEQARLEAEAARKKGAFPALPVVTTATGVGALGFGVVNGLAALRHRKALRDPSLCSADGICKSEAEPIFARQRKAALLADVGTLSGVVLTGVGATLFLTRSNGADLRVMPTGQGLRIEGSFGGNDDAR